MTDWLWVSALVGIGVIVWVIRGAMIRAEDAQLRRIRRTLAATRQKALLVDETPKT